MDSSHFTANPSDPDEDSHFTFEMMEENLKDIQSALGLPSDIVKPDTVRHYRHDILFEPKIITRDQKYGVVKLPVVDLNLDDD